MKWISVKDRLPEINIEVLVYDTCDGVQLCTYSRSIYDETKLYWKYSGCSSCCTPNLSYITHWSYLLEEPKD